ncbi:RDD family protein [Citricoccus sp. GCM10030269]|uniref:RDD family protein n=1 Tax=Citricoccus sp. GCM10030269 TaxID=3273388 RepID=UPI0036073698
MQKTLNLVNAPAGKRLAAWLIDQIIPVAVVAIASGVTLPPVLESTGSAQQEALASYSMAMLVAGVVCLAYTVWLWGWQASAGKTPGNLVLGLRVTSEEGTPAGWGTIFLRWVIIAVSGLVPVIGPVLMLLSNIWDTNHQRQGWHDKVARTLVVDVNAGRNPLTTGGLYGPSTFAPGALEPGDPGHPETGVSVPPASRWPAFNPAVAAGPITAVPGTEGGARQDQPAQPSSGAVPSAPAAPPAVAPATPPAPAAPPVVGEPSTSGAGHSSSGYSENQVVLVGGAAEAADPDQEMGSTQLRSQVAEPAAIKHVKLKFDDGQSHELTGSALVGRNPAPTAGESVDLLIPFADMGRSVSKTHLHLTVDAAGVWVTDRNSTNGSGVTPRGGERQRLEPGQPVLAPAGATVHFGDRSFTVSAA